MLKLAVNGATSQVKWHDFIFHISYLNYGPPIFWRSRGSDCSGVQEQLSGALHRHCRPYMQILGSKQSRS